MKFKDPKTGKVFEDIVYALDAFDCSSITCAECPIGTNRCRMSWLEDHPTEAARLMGYEVVEENETVAENATVEQETVVFNYHYGIGDTATVETEAVEIGKQKPLKDWTLGEFKEYCASFNGNCTGCKFIVGDECMTNSMPSRWDLSDKPQFTDVEVEDALTIVRLFSGAWDGIEISRCHDGTLLVLSRAGDEVTINKDLFPSIQPMQSVKLSDIIGDDA